MTFGQETDKGLADQVLLSGDTDSDGSLDRCSDFGILVDEVFSRLSGDDSLSLLSGLLGQPVEIGLHDSPE